MLLLLSVLSFCLGCMILCCIKTNRLDGRVNELKENIEDLKKIVEENSGKEG